MEIPVPSDSAMAHAYTLLNYAFVLRPDDVKRLWTLLSAKFKLNALAHCADDLERDFSTADELLAYQNTRSKQMRTLDLQGSCKLSEGYARISFSSRSIDSPISLMISGDESDIGSLRHQILDVLEGARAWYSPVCKVDFSLVFGCLVVFSWLVLRFAVGDSNSSEGVPWEIAFQAAVLLSACLIVLIFVSIGLHRLQERYFPKGMFALGQGHRRYKTDDKVRWIIFVGAAVSVSRVLQFGQ